MFFQNIMFVLFNTVNAFATLLPAPPSPSRHGTIQFKTEGNITRATFNNPTLNLVSAELISDLYDFLTSLDPLNRTTPPPKVVIFSSANSDFFLDHLDLTLLLPPTTPAKATTLNKYVAVNRLFQSLTSTAFIAEMNGRAFGAGHELAVQMDMRFAGPKAHSGSIEDALGLTAGAGGQLFLGTLVGRGRALEYLLSANVFDGPTGAAAGLFNHYYETVGELRTAVDQLAARIGLLPREGLNETKFALGRLLNPSIQALDYDVEAFNAIAGGVEQQKLLGLAVAASRNQSLSSFELGLPDSMVELSGPLEKGEL